MIYSRISSKSLIGFILIFAVFGLLGATALHAYQTRYVIVVIIDGVRYTESLGDATGTYCPRLTALSHQGVVLDSAFNDSVTVTAWGVPALWMGRWYELQDTTYLGNQIRFCRYPTAWEYARHDLLLPSGKAIDITPDYSSSKWRSSFYPGYGPDYWPVFVQPPISDNNNQGVFDSAVVVLQRNHPVITYIYLPDTDHAGHSGVRADYIAKIRQADSLTVALWDIIQTDTAMAGKTAMFVTNDHGRHDDAHGGFRNHGDGCFGCRHVMLLAVGPDFKQDTHLDSLHSSIIDIAKTAGELLGFDPIYSPGRILHELFIQNSCSYVSGDINGDHLRGGGDVTYGVRFFKQIGNRPPDSCYMDSTSSYLYVAGDVNGNCEFRGSDITRLVAYFKGYMPLSYCHFFPPLPMRESRKAPALRD
jgi:hypothetical protein